MIDLSVFYPNIAIKPIAIYKEMILINKRSVLVYIQGEKYEDI
jgi:hypothetical protein